MRFIYFLLAVILTPIGKKFVYDKYFNTKRVTLFTEYYSYRVFHVLEGFMGVNRKTET